MDSNPCRLKGCPFDTFSEIHFWQTDPKVFLKAPKNGFLTVFSKICLRQNRGKTVLWKSSKNQFGNLVDLKKKKGRQNFGKFFENPPPPRENPKSAPEEEPKN